MFAIVRTGGKQYRVAAGDKIVVDRMDGEAGARVTLGDVLLTSTGETGLTVAAEIIAQAKADKVIVFKKKRRHNYRRKNGHRQQHTILQIVSIGAAPAADKKAKKEAAPAETAPVAVEAEAAAAPAPKAAKAAKVDAAPKAEKAAAPKKAAAKPAAKKTAE
jgi:large subunit ribosomal protein L21